MPSALRRRSGRPTAALFPSTWSRGWTSRRRRAKARTEAWLERSTGITVTWGLPVSSAMASLVMTPRISLRQASTTVAPRRPRFRATSLPLPELAPVTMHTRPAKSTTASTPMTPGALIRTFTLTNFFPLPFSSSPPFIKGGPGGIFKGGAQGNPDYSRRHVSRPERLLTPTLPFSSSPPFIKGGPGGLFKGGAYIGAYALRGRG